MGKHRRKRNSIPPLPLTAPVVPGEQTAGRPVRWGEPAPSQRPYPATQPATQAVACEQLQAHYGLVGLLTGQAYLSSLLGGDAA